MSDLVGKILVKTLTSHNQRTGVYTWCLFLEFILGASLLQLPANAYLGGQQLMAQIVLFLLPMWDAWTWFPAPGCSLAQP